MKNQVETNHTFISKRIGIDGIATCRLNTCLLAVSDRLNISIKNPYFQASSILQCLGKETTSPTDIYNFPYSRIQVRPKQLNEIFHLTFNKVVMVKSLNFILRQNLLCFSHICQSKK